MSGNVLNVPQRVNADDLLFAAVRARYLAAPEDVAFGLRHAAGHPERLDGVTPYQVLAEAGELLTAAGLHKQAVNVLREAVAAAPASHDPAARISLAAALARARGAREVEGLAAGGPGARGPAVQGSAARAADEARRYAQARRWAESAIQHSPHSVLGYRLAKMAHERTQQTGGAPGSSARPGSGMPGPQPRAPGPGRPVPPPFPARAGDAVLWWPDRQYQRLMRQLPELAPALGWPWPQHLATTENALRSISASGHAGAWLMPADFGQFAGYLKQAGTDPRALETLWGYAAHAVASGTPAPWPPRPRRPCWCGSERRYSDCCGTAVPGWSGDAG
jgi:SEC-C motif